MNPFKRAKSEQALATEPSADETPAPEATPRRWFGLFRRREGAAEGESLPHEGDAGRDEAVEAAGVGRFAFWRRWRRAQGAAVIPAEEVAIIEAMLNEPVEPAAHLDAPHVRTRRRWMPRAQSQPDGDEPPGVVDEPEADAPPAGRWWARLLPWRRRAARDDAGGAASEEEVEAGASRRRLPRPRLSFPWRPRPGVLLFALVMFGAAAVGTAINLGVIAPEVTAIWPLALVALGAAVLPRALKRDAGGRLFVAFALIAVGASLTLAEVELFPVQWTLMTALLIALGFTVMVRAVLLHGAE